MEAVKYGQPYFTAPYYILNELLQFKGGFPNG
jgi:hypothetical protein